MIIVAPQDAGVGSAALDAAKLHSIQTKVVSKLRVGESSGGVSDSSEIIAADLVIEITAARAPAPKLAGRDQSLPRIAVSVSAAGGANTWVNEVITKWREFESSAGKSFDTIAVVGTNDILSNFIRQDLRSGLSTVLKSVSEPSAAPESKPAEAPQASAESGEQPDSQN